MTNRILILGGTSEARRIALRLAQRPDAEVLLSLAGRTQAPPDQGVRTRHGGFGGVDGLAEFLRQSATGLLVDATHPYAARMSANAADAAARAGIRLLALRRPGWTRVVGDRWTVADSVAGAVLALGRRQRRVFLALGRQEAGAFGAAPQHRYLVRSVDPVVPPLDVPDARYILARGPFAEADERKLLLDNGIDAIVCKDSGGEATYGKIAAARALGIQVVMIARPALPDVPSAGSIEGLLALVDHALAPVAERGV